VVRRGVFGRASEGDGEQQQNNVYFISLEVLHKNTIFPSLSHLVVSDSNS
jgi:hypothetical protein